MVKTAYIRGVEVSAYDFEPADDQWQKFLDFAHKAAVAHNVQADIKAVYVTTGVREDDHGAYFYISYSALLEAGKLYQTEVTDENHT